MKTLREKEKLLVTSNLSFSLNVFIFIVMVIFPPLLPNLKLLSGNGYLYTIQNCLLTMDECPENKRPDTVFEPSLGYEA